VVMTLLKFALGWYVELCRLSKAFIGLGRCWRSINGPSGDGGWCCIMRSLIRHPVR
jgi:hypothetical protein